MLNTQFSIPPAFRQQAVQFGQLTEANYNQLFTKQGSKVPLLCTKDGGGGDLFLISPTATAGQVTVYDIKSKKTETIPFATIAPVYTASKKVEELLKLIFMSQNQEAYTAMAEFLSKFYKPTA